MIPGFDAKTGGVRAEALIKFAAYSDLASCLAGNSLDLSDVSARLAALKLTKRAQGAVGVGSAAGLGGAAGAGGIGSSSRRLSASAAHASAPAAKADLTAVAAAAELVDIAMGIPPVQGLPVAAPLPPLPETWRRLGVYAAVALVPVAVLHEYLFERSLFYQLDRAAALAPVPSDGAAPYPLFLATSATTLGSQPFSACLASAQALTLLSLALWLVLTSAFFLNREHRFGKLLFGPRCLAQF